MGLLALFPFHEAHAGFFAAATEPTQIMNNVQLVEQTGRLGQQLATVRNTLQLLKDNFARLGPDKWAALDAALGSLAANVTQGQRLAFGLSRADEEFRRRFAKERKTPKFSILYQRWWLQNHKMVEDVLGRLGMQARDFQDERRALKRIQTLSRHSMSRDQVLQAGNELALAQSMQLQGLRAIAMEQAKLQGFAFVSEQEERRAERDALRRALTFSRPNRSLGQRR